MSGTQKKGFAAFLRPQAPEPDPAPLRPAEAAAPSPVVMPEPPAPAGEGPHLQMVPPTAAPPPGSIPAPPPTAAAAPAPAPVERIRTVTSTGRVRTHSANRQLPGVTYRVSEERWERLKMLSIQERRPIQDVLGEAMEAYMRNRGLPWLGGACFVMHASRIAQWEAVTQSIGAGQGCLRHFGRNTATRVSSRQLRPASVLHGSADWTH